MDAIRDMIWFLVCGDWNHGFLYNFMTFHIFFGNFIIPTDELHHFSEGWLNHQPDQIWPAHWRFLMHLSRPWGFEDLCALGQAVVRELSACRAAWQDHARCLFIYIHLWSFIVICNHLESFIFIFMIYDSWSFIIMCNHL